MNFYDMIDGGDDWVKKTIKEIIVVEGRSDTSKLKSLFECDTLETSGSRLSPRTLEMIKQMNETRGIIVFTDPDYPGMQIRQKINAYVGPCKQAFVHKKDAIAHHKVGIAEATPEAIVEALECCCDFNPHSQTISWASFIHLDLIGHKKKRLYVYDYFHLGYGNAKTLFKRLNMACITEEEVKQCIEEYENGIHRND